MLERIKADAKKVPATIGYKLRNGLATLDDQEEACKNPQLAYLFARNVPGADMVKCQEGACKDPYWTGMFEILLRKSFIFGSAKVKIKSWNGTK